MHLLAWVVIGAVVGRGTGRVLQGNGYGPLMDTLMGIGGAVVGGFAMSSAGLGGYGLSQKIYETKWYFFYLAGEIRASALGREGLGTLRRAVMQILAKREGQKFNSLEITKVASKRFLGIPFMSITAHFRHIQQGICLVPAKNFVLRMFESGSSGGGEERHGAVAGKQYAALISSS